MNQLDTTSITWMDRFRVQIAVLVSVVLVAATEHSTGWLTIWGSQASFPSRGWLIQFLYLGNPFVLVLLACITWLYWRNKAVARRILIMALIHAVCQFIPTTAILLPANFLTPVVAIVWSICARFPHETKYAIGGWLAISVVAIASIGVLHLHWFWLGVQWTLGIILGQGIHILLRRVSHAAMQPRKSVSYKWEWRSNEQTNTHPAW